MASSFRSIVLLGILALLLFSYEAHAFGAGNIASISAVEGKNWRHGDIEDVLKQVSCIRKHKWSSMMIKRVYFGNWLRDYSQAMDTGALKKAQPETIRILVWLLSFLGFGYATAEFEVTSERLGVYRPEEHIDNPKDYNDNLDARQYDPRLRAPVRDIELAIDPETGMKNYIANGKGDWATSAAFVKYSFERSIHHGRLYTSGHGLFKGKDEDLAEACRCLGQGLHTLEDFGAHTNYVELALIEMGHRDVFAHVGTQTMINLQGKNVYPLVTGTFGMVDFYHSVLGEATDHFTQSEVNEMDNALGIAEQSAQSSNPLTTLIKLLSKVPGTRDLCTEAQRLSAASQAQARAISSSRAGPGDLNSQSYQQPDWSGLQVVDQGQDQWGHQQQQDWNQPQQQPQWNQPQHPQSYNMQSDTTESSGSLHDWNAPQQQPSLQVNPSQQAVPQTTPGEPLEQPQSTTQSLPGINNFDPAKFIQQIYPILAFRDKVVRAISAIIEKIPGLEELVERIMETLTVFILSLLAPFVRPVLNAIAKSLQTGSEGVIDSAAKHQFEVWTNPASSDPTHSMLSKDHFSNLLNDPAGHVAAEILKFIAPRVLYAWEHPDVPVQQVLADVDVIFHHPAIRNEHVEVHRTMYQAVQKWKNEYRGTPLDQKLSSESVRAGNNLEAGVNEHAQVSHGQNMPQQQQQQNAGQQGGFAGMMNYAESFIPGQHGGGQQGGSQGGGSGGGMMGQAMHFAESFMPGQHGGLQQQQQQHHSSSGGGSGLGDVLNLAGKLPIPGASNLGKFGKLMGATGGGGGAGHGSFGLGQFANFASGGRRGLDGEPDIGGSREVGDVYDTPERPDRSPSPMPLAPPEGYEQYTATSLLGGGYGPQAGDYLQQQGGGGGEGGYVRTPGEFQQQGYGGGYMQQDYTGGGQAAQGGTYYR